MLHYGASGEGGAVYERIALHPDIAVAGRVSFNQKSFFGYGSLAFNHIWSRISARAQWMCGRVSPGAGRDGVGNGFHLKDFLTESLVEGVSGGLASAAFFGLGQGIEKLQEGIRGCRQNCRIKYAGGI